MRPHAATQYDLQDIRGLLLTCGLPCKGLPDHPEAYLVVRDTAGMLGCACVEPYGSVAVLRAIAVAERGRRAGLGELLMEALVSQVRQSGVQTLVLRSRDASGYFTRLGFTPVEPAAVPPSVLSAPGFVADEANTDLLMQAEL